MSKTTIEWTRGSSGEPGKSWNPMRGCSLASDECQFCYAQSIARRFSGPGKPFEGLINRHGKWNGVMRQAPEHTLYEPLTWRRPTRVFVNSMTDLFHENAEEWWIDQIFAVMSLCPQHSFIILTKRAERMREYCSAPDVWDRVDAMQSSIIEERVDALARRTDDLSARAMDEWPLHNVILGVSVGRREFLARIDHLRETPAAVRMVSFEPLLEDLGTIDLRGIGWAVVGSESGRGARSCDLDWVRSLRDQSAAAGTAFFWKQHADRGSKIPTPELDGKKWVEYPI